MSHFETPIELSANIRIFNNKIFQPKHENMTPALSETLNIFNQLPFLLNLKKNDQENFIHS